MAGKASPAARRVGAVEKQSRTPPSRPAGSRCHGQAAVLFCLLLCLRVTFLPLQYGPHSILSCISACGGPQLEAGPRTGARKRLIATGGRDLARQLANSSPPPHAPEQHMRAPTPDNKAGLQEAASTGREDRALAETALRIQDMAKQLRAVDDEYEAEMRALQEDRRGPDACPDRPPAGISAGHSAHSSAASDAGAFLPLNKGVQIETPAADGMERQAREYRGLESPRAAAQDAEPEELHAFALSPASQSIQRC